MAIAVFELVVVLCMCGCLVRCGGVIVFDVRQVDDTYLKARRWGFDDVAVWPLAEMMTVDLFRRCRCSHAGC